MRKFTRGLRSLRYVAALACIHACECDQVDPPIREVPCDYENTITTITEPQDSCLGDVIMPSTLFLRTTGSPNQFETSFRLPHAGEICIRIHNGTSKPVSASWISVDAPAADANVLAPSDLNQNVDDLEVRRTVSTGDHSLNLKIASAPTADLRIEIRFAAVYTETEIHVAEQLSALQQATCLAWNEQMSFQSAADAEARRIQQVKLGIGPGELHMRMNAYGTARRLEPLPDVAVGQGSSDSTETVARKWIAHFAALTGLSDSRVSLALAYVKPSRRGWDRVRFREHVAGLPVDNGYLEVGVAGLQVRRFNGNIVAPPTDLQATLSPTDAITRALASITGTSSGGTPVLVVYDLSQPSGSPDSRLAWRVPLKHQRHASSQVAWVDAHSGDVIAKQDSALPGDFLVSKGDSVARGPNEPEPLTAILDTGSGIDLCTGDDEEWCGHVQQTMGLLDLELRTEYARSGWSGTGLGALPGVPGSEVPADDDYRVVMDPDEPGDGFWFGTPALQDDAPNLFSFPSRSGRRADGRFLLLNKTSSFASHPSGTSPTRDVIRHEFGHGIYQVEVGLHGTVQEATPLSFLFLTEHAAEYWASANDDDTTPFVATVQVGLPPIRDHRRLSCEVSEARAFECQSSPTQLFVDDECATYEHFNGFMADLTLDVDEFDWNHRNACVFDAIAFRLLTRSTQFAHGVSSRGMGGRGARFILYELLTEHATITDDQFDWASNYRAAVGTLVAKCDPLLGTGGAACPTDRDPLNDGISPLWGGGFYSEEIILGGISNALQSRRAPAVAVTAAGASLFFVDLANHLQVATFTDPIDRTPPTSVDLTSQLSLPGTITNLAVSAETAGTILLTYVTDNAVGQNIFVARVNLGSTSVTFQTVPGLASTRAAQDRPAIQSGTQWLLVFSAEDTLKLTEVAQGTAPVPLPVGGPADCGQIPDVEQPTGGTGPTLTRDPLFGTVALVYQNREDKFQFQPFELISRRRTANGKWCFPIQVQNLEPGGRYGMGAPIGVVGHLSPPTAGLTTISSGPPAITYFPPPSFFPPVFPRLQVFSSFAPTSAPGQLKPAAPPQVRQLSIGPPLPPADSKLVFDKDTITRNVPISQGGEDGITVATFVHPVQGPILLVYHLGVDIFSTQIVLSYKRSD